MAMVASTRRRSTIYDPRITIPQAGVISDFVSDQQGERGLGQCIEGAGPRVQVDALAVVQGAEAVVETADGQIRVRVVQAAVEFRQRAIAGGGVVPVG